MVFTSGLTKGSAHPVFLTCPSATWRCSLPLVLPHVSVPQGEPGAPALGAHICYCLEAHEPTAAHGQHRNTGWALTELPVTLQCNNIPQLAQRTPRTTISKAHFARCLTYHTAIPDQQCFPPVVLSDELAQAYVQLCSEPHFSTEGRSITIKCLNISPVPNISKLWY